MKNYTFSIDDTRKFPPILIVSIHIIELYYIAEKCY